MVWSLALDDFGKICKTSRRHYPLLSTVAEELIRAEKGLTGKPTQLTTTTSSRTRKTRPPITTPLPPYPDDGM